MSSSALWVSALSRIGVEVVGCPDLGISAVAFLLDLVAHLAALRVGCPEPRPAPAKGVPNIGPHDARLRCRVSPLPVSVASKPMAPSGLRQAATDVA